MFHSSSLSLFIRRGFHSTIRVSAFNLLPPFLSSKAGTSPFQLKRCRSAKSEDELERKLDLARGSSGPVNHSGVGQPPPAGVP